MKILKLRENSVVCSGSLGSYVLGLPAQVFWIWALCVMHNVVLVTVLLLWWHTITKGTYKRKYLIIGLLTVSEDLSMIILKGGMTAGRQAWCWAATESSHLMRGRGRGGRGGEGETETGPVWAFDTSKPTSSDTALTGPHLYIASPPSPSQITQLTEGPMGSIIIHTTANMYALLKLHGLSRIVFPLRISYMHILCFV